MSEVVERVALALWVAYGQPGPYALYADVMRKMAHAAIGAMREPTYAMACAPGERGLAVASQNPDGTWGEHIVVHSGAAEAAWTMMIDAALSGETKS